MHNSDIKALIDIVIADKLKPREQQDPDQTLYILLKLSQALGR